MAAEDEEFECVMGLGSRCTSGAVSILGGSGREKVQKLLEMTRDVYFSFRDLHDGTSELAHIDAFLKGTEVPPAVAEFVREVFMAMASFNVGILKKVWLAARDFADAPHVHDSALEGIVRIGHLHGSADEQYFQLIFFLLVGGVSQGLICAECWLELLEAGPLEAALAATSFYLGIAAEQVMLTVDDGADFVPITGDVPARKLRPAVTKIMAELFDDDYVGLMFESLPPEGSLQRLYRSLSVRLGEVAGQRKTRAPTSVKSFEFETEERAVKSSMRKRRRASVSLSRGVDGLLLPDSDELPLPEVPHALAVSPRKNHSVVLEKRLQQRNKEHREESKQKYENSRGEPAFTELSPRPITAADAPDPVIRRHPVPKFVKERRRKKEEGALDEDLNVLLIGSTKSSLLRSQSQLERMCDYLADTAEDEARHKALFTGMNELEEARKQQIVARRRAEERQKEEEIRLRAEERKQQKIAESQKQNEELARRKAARVAEHSGYLAKLRYTQRQGSEKDLRDKIMQEKNAQAEAIRRAKEEARIARQKEAEAAKNRFPVIPSAGQRTALATKQSSSAALLEHRGATGASQRSAASSEQRGVHFQDPPDASPRQSRAVREPGESPRQLGAPKKERGEPSSELRRRVHAERESEAKTVQSATLSVADKLQRARRIKQTHGLA